MQAYIVASKIHAKHGKMLKDSDLSKVIITIHNQEDNEIRFSPKLLCNKYNFKNIDPTTAVRRNKILRITYEVYKQKCVLTEEDLAYKILNCGIRTIQRDIAAFKNAEVFIPLKGLVCDIGKSITHKAEAIKIFLEGLEINTIAKKINHSVSSVNRYIRKFIQLCMGFENGLKDPEISMLTQTSYSLISEYKKLYNKAKSLNKMSFLYEFIKDFPSKAKKKAFGGIK